MIYITGDTHGDFRNVERFCKKMQTSKDDVLIILGDAGINYYGPEQDKRKKKYLESLPITIFAIHGNHEMRPHFLKIKMAKSMMKMNCAMNAVYTMITHI